MKFTLFAAFLFSIGWMSILVAGVDRPASCCLQVLDTIIKVENILYYDMQNVIPCDIRAVRFHTKKSKTVCSDPDSNWAKWAMRIVDGRTTTKPSQTPSITYQTCHTRTTNMIPTVTTTIKTPETETETSTSTTVTPAVTTIKTSETETSMRTTVTPAVATSTPETEISKTTILSTSTSTSIYNPESTTITCGTGESTATPTETTREMPGIGTVTPLTTFTATDNTVFITTHTSKRTTLSKLMIKKRRKIKKGLRKIQMNLKNKPG